LNLENPNPGIIILLGLQPKDAMLPSPFQETRIAAKIKIVAPGDFVEIARNSAIAGDILNVLEKQF
jgi:hypothetical protein